MTDRRPSVLSRRVDPPVASVSADNPSAPTIRRAETVPRPELITELRAMIVTLAGVERAGIDRLDRLLELAGASDIHVDVEVTGDRGVLAPALEHTAYRVLQEALTNAARHAPGADILVRLDFGRSGLALEVANETRSPPAPATSGPGQGLTGMRERVEACGGRIATGTGTPGRFTVRAWLPGP